MGAFQDWNARQLTNPADSFNYLSSHFIVNENVLLPAATTNFARRAMAGRAVGPVRADPLR